MAIVLIIKTEDEQITELPITSKTTIGRSSASDLKVSDGKMSGVHCAFELTPRGELLFTDLESTNGSYINNSKVHKSLMRLNDIVRVGNTLIKVDERKLTTPERLQLGSSNLSGKKDQKTLPNLDHLKLPPNRPEEAKKKTVALNKSIKEKARPDSTTWEKLEDTVLDQEESTGHTRFLKLDKDKGKKK